MKIEVKPRYSICELIITADNTVIKEDVAGINRKIPDDLIDDFVTALVDLCVYSGIEGKDILHKVGARLSNNDINEFLEEKSNEHNLH